MREMQSLKVLFFALFQVMVLSAFMLNAQQSYSLKGIVVDEFGHSLVGATVQIVHTEKGAITDKKGAFQISGINPSVIIVRYSFLGYRSVTDTIDIRNDKTVFRKLYPENRQLNELTVTEKQRQLNNGAATLSMEMVDKKFLQENVSGSLMQTLSRLPGVSSMDIGAGQSKPVIRGLGFNRVAVAENGIKHEAQEWGVDHGLEIDQFSVEKVEVIKGPASLMYGANAIGGVIDLKQIATPQINSSGGNVLLHMQSNNDYYGASAKFFQRFNRFYYKVNGTYADYSDYRIPTDSINYMTYNIVLKNNRLRNTAGRERNGSIVLGYLTERFSTHLSISDNFSKSGFFANAHGLEIRNSLIDYDHSSRDIDLPRQQVNHFKVLNNTIWMITDYKINIDLGYQNNYRQEFSERVAHGYMPIPPDTLERLYQKNTWSANVKLELPKHDIHRLTMGADAALQQNNSGGWGFMLPDFNSVNAGAYVYDNIRFTEKWMMHAGIRYDYGRLQTNAYSDWYLTKQNDGTWVYVQRAWALNRNWGSWSGGVGLHYANRDFSLKANVGKSFRMPTAKELASNGINYHMYRFEKGDSALKAEESYQFDLALNWTKKRWSLAFTPFANYFPNYIYLNPTPDYYEAQQVYYYSQSSVFRAGGEIMAEIDLTNALKLSVDAEYVYSHQLSGSKKNYTLPFSPPLTSNIEIVYSPASKGIVKNPVFGALCKLVAAQNDRVPPEKRTPGYVLWNLRAGAEFHIVKQAIQFNVQLVNVFNTRYYDHTSFYRLIEVPGMGRNLQVSMSFPINHGDDC